MFEALIAWIILTPSGSLGETGSADGKMLEMAFLAIVLPIIISYVVWAIRDQKQLERQSRRPFDDVV